MQTLCSHTCPVFLGIRSGMSHPAIQLSTDKRSSKALISKITLTYCTFSFSTYCWCKSKTKISASPRTELAVFVQVYFPMKCVGVLGTRALRLNLCLWEEKNKIILFYKLHLSASMQMHMCLCNQRMLIFFRSSGNVASLQLKGYLTF